MSEEIVSFESLCFGEDQFFLFEEDVDNAVAQSRCLDLNLTLARVEDQAAYDFVLDFRKSAGLGLRFWIGVLDQDGVENFGTDRFTFVDGQNDNLTFVDAGVGLFPWTPGEPNNANSNEDCVE